MDSVSMEGLLRAREERLRGELTADDQIEKDRKRSVERLREAFGEMLLRYNAEYSDDRTRQALADCLTATAGELFPLLLVGSVKTESSARRVRPAGLTALLLSTVCALAAVLLYSTYPLVSYGLFALCALGLFLAGRFWFTERTEHTRVGVDAELLWRTICRTGETMDRKIDAFCAQARVWEKERDAKVNPGADSIAPEELQLFADLLEGLYSGNGDFSLRQLKKVLPWLTRHGVDIVEYSPGAAASFELLPTKNESRTLRPALMAGDRLLLAGRAAEHTDAGPKEQK